MIKSKLVARPLGVLGHVEFGTPVVGRTTPDNCSPVMGPTLASAITMAFIG